MSILEHTFQTLALAEPDRPWELDHGVMREKPSMSIAHNRAMMRLTRLLIGQLDFGRYDIRTNCGRVARGDQTCYIPDVYVIPALNPSAESSTDALEIYVDPLPLVVEIWSPSTGAYDIDAKLPEYQRRGDLEIWRIQPRERSVTIWRRQPDGGYSETRIESGTVEIASLPGVVIDLDAPFA